MRRPIEALADEVLHLPAAARSELLDRVVASLDVDRARERAWDAIAERRDAEVDSGDVSTIPGPELLDKLRAELE